jgi:hypothetical protein
MRNIKDTPHRTRDNDAVGGGQQVPDLPVEGHVRHHLRPRLRPQLHDRRILRFPDLGELQEPCFGVVGVHRGQHGLEVARERRPVAFGGVSEAVALQVDQTSLHDRPGPDPVDRFWQPVRAVAQHDAAVLDTAVADLRERGLPGLGALPAVPGPQSQDLPGAARGDRDRTPPGWPPHRPGSWFRR